MAKTRTIKENKSRSFSRTARNYLRTRQRTKKLCKPLAAEDYVVQPVTDVSPPKWHLGHTTWFFENFILSKHCPSYKLFNPDFNYMFNSYYNSQGDRVMRPDRGNMSRPTTKEILSYRAHVDEKMTEFLEGQEELSDEIKLFLNIGINHEEQHQELLLYDIKFILGNNPLFPVYREKKKEIPAIGAAVPMEFMEVGEGIYQIGYAGNKFHFDNEEGVHKIFLHPFRIANRPVTNGEYLEFINDGAYGDFRHWLDDGWAWLREQDIKKPLHWHKTEGKWKTFTLNGLEDIDLSAPVTHLSFYEAEAFARWKGKRLPTEHEWEVACKLYSPTIPENANLMENEIFQPAAAEKNNMQFYGDVWEWTNSAYLPYPFYKQNEGALGEYNGKFMINQMVLRGGSCATPKEHIRPTYRNFFHPRLQWMFSGIRLAETVR